MLVVIGSQATNVAVDLGRKLNDFDLVGQYDELISYFKSKRLVGIQPFNEGKKMVARGPNMVYEAEVAWEGSLSEDLMWLVLRDPYTRVIDGMAFAHLDVCYMLKMTHRFRKNSPHFLKTMGDIHVMRKAGATIRPEHQDFYERRLKATLSYGHPKLNQTKKAFFTDSVKYVYDHDSIHTAVARLDKPAYNYYKPDENEVYCSQELFDKSDIAIRLLGVYEESCVLALERSQIPHPETDPKRSFDIALEKVCTSITSGWFREFAWENYHNVQKIYEAETATGRNYLSLFHKGLAKGLVKPHAHDN